MRPRIAIFSHPVERRSMRLLFAAFTSHPVEVPETIVEFKSEVESTNQYVILLDGDSMEKCRADPPPHGANVARLMHLLVGAISDAVIEHV